MSRWALFAVIALKDSAEAVDQAMTIHYPASSYKIEPGKWVVNAADASTAKELSTQLGLATAQLHLILPIRGYFGRAQPDLWEWLAKTNA